MENEQILEEKYFLSNKQNKEKQTKGEFFIKMRNADGLEKEVYYENLIVDDFGIFLALACDNPKTMNTGIMWLGLGSGNATWDPAPAGSGIVTPPAVSETALIDEKTRKKRDTSLGFQYMQVGSPNTASGTPTRIIQMKWTFDYNEANGFPIREIGMYANSAISVTTVPTDYTSVQYVDATTTPLNIATVIGSSGINGLRGILVNKKHFAAINKDSDWQLEIIYRITFGGN